MNETLALVLLISVGLSAFCHWRAWRLDRLLLEVDPFARRIITHLLDYVSHRKE
ncbi:hypothetical protein EDF56_106311 [Novosphingobium sp. PhB165]|uniref:hypothetical protein n=1 Tax=Novosphingobium sp. PhB165 TaxID=2485105 RepID=UPI0010DB4B6A|nr:hypothetical protein [Novosphingobium sp. PhB165]TCM17195.1 hypothetical protein EDF56_106311 [Novosphingobium sp. PhB165]